MSQILKFFVGRRSDWHLHRPWFRLPQARMHWIGPLAVALSTVAGWFAFSGTAGLDSNSTFSMFIGSVSIVLMAWSFILALRIRVLERFWGGLDSMYRGHRWAGTLAVGAMYLHTAIEPETKGAAVVRDFSSRVADAAEDLAETGQTMLYILIGVSIVRLLPYRWWKWTHKLLGIPFAFASWHFFTAAKPYANASGWGIWFAGFMAAGLAAFVARVFIRDSVAQGKEYTIVDAVHAGNLTRIELQPKGRPISFESGQFAFLRIEAKGMREPHPFSIASGASRDHLTFWIRHLGDWSDRLPDTSLVGTKVMVEGAYGEFDPLGDGDNIVWIAGGVGITPFLAALDELQPGDPVPTVLYACRDSVGDPLVELLHDAHRRRAIDLQVFSSPDRLTPEALDSAFPGGMANHHVALCGPAGLVRSMAQAASDRGARSIETEDFDIRQGFGPDRSREIAAASTRLVRS